MGAADTPLSELARQLSERTPAPGGGAAAAAAAALAAGLVEMAAQFTLARAEYAELHPRAQEIAGIAAQARAQSLGLIDHDLEAYAPVLEALALPRTDPARNGRIRAASSRAAIPPLEMARVGAQLAELGAELARDGNPNLEGDALAGALLAEAACGTAARLVQINLAGSDDPADERARGQAAALAERAQDARRLALSASRSRAR
jgi:methenyltetrahydrofolate cyclohydrolase